MTRELPGDRRARARAAADAYGDVLSRRLLRDLGITHDHVRHEVDAERWRTYGHQTVALHRGRLDDHALRWRAIWEVGHRIATLDGVSSLQARGLAGFTSDALHVSIPHGTRPYVVTGVMTHRVNRVPAELGGEVVGAGLPSTRPEVAALRAANWAVSDRQAALILCLVVQQRLTTAERLQETAGILTVRGRRSFVRTLLGDLAGGVQSLGELDFARACRERGLPEPSRQRLVETPTGRIYLDVHWDDVGLTAEIDGVQHRLGLAYSEDNLGRNAVVIEGGTVIRIDVVGFRLMRDQFLDQVCRAHRRLSGRAA